tara:strand:- start:26 stop:274 length:249 start_codon:yes stop_codon:yes gene_type:complete
MIGVLTAIALLFSGFGYVDGERYANVGRSEVSAAGFEINFVSVLHSAIESNLRPLRLKRSLLENGPVSGFHPDPYRVSCCRF